MKYLTAFVLIMCVALFSCSKQELTNLDTLDKSTGTDVGSNAVSGTPVEQKYTVEGTNAVKFVIEYDSEGKKQKIFYPASLSKKYPVITWGNGTGSPPDRYTKIFTHLASWGYIVIDNFNGSTADGSSILASAEYMIAQNTNKNSIFFNKVDTARIGTAGHSQGGAGVINAAANWPNSGIIKAIVPISMSPQNLIPSNSANIKKPIFFISGTKDFLSTYTTNSRGYNSLPNGVPAALGMRIGADHEAIRLTTKETGYVTAWFQFWLKGDKTASLAFSGGSAELLSNPNWTKTSTKYIP